MIENKKSSRRAWRDPDDAPDLSKGDWQDRFQQADLKVGQKIMRRGRPPAAAPKVSTTLRLDADVVEHFRSEGRGWQTRLNAALRRAAGL